jgi:hypothetical protein
VILLDENYLLHLRRGYNLRVEISARRPSYNEIAWPNRLRNLRYMHHLYEQLRRVLQMSSSGAAPPCAQTA